MIPQVKEMFKLTNGRNMAGAKTIQLLTRCVNNMGTFELIAPALKSLGQDHVKMNIRRQYLDLFEDVFIKTLSQVLRDEWNSELKRIFTKLYTLVKNTMMGDQSDDEQICDLCRRAQPVFVVGHDNPIMRMREDYLPDFLKDLKRDFQKNREYFSVLKINSKFV
mmetsp:Transcript_6754/g.10865  ORF Transcript_6754/g.10865 Transcript_6754/m.10865 type:complete len:164 (+) Transcript_6754:325-816(+)